eukprot:CAMPEP_0172508602 /NCGR_PEP_ID=MMETSP1066-20121228/213255_1 /TAXON_ID=671091 /ORGANISM="Coscinodiscus wailesii, Strain CCMP2513" /LENGTH=586 /DNA_ID=CAMNT_0013286641 /DNA_START=282 /DNA_END=2042 /DNA_ORIENTATION=+
MATNYVDTVEGKKYTDPPYYLRPDLDIPDKYLLIDTHCSGTCLTCDNEKNYVTKSLPTFFESCAAVSYADYPLYDPKLVTKVVHLIRNPFDNVVVRFLNARKHYERVHNERWEYPNDREGLRNWCYTLQSQTAVVGTMKLSDELRGIAREVPCYGLFYQYVVWHNNLYDTIHEYGLKHLELHYSDLNTSDNDTKQNTIKKLSSFLEQNMRRGSFPKLPKENYADYFTPGDRQSVSSFLKVLAARDFWSNMKRYVPDPTQVDKYRALGSALSPRHYGAWPEVVWAMTFPNSGTHYIVEAVTDASGGTAAATNYQEEAGQDQSNVPNFALTPNGPYRYHDRPFPKDYVITKTHCLRCHDCSPSSKELIISTDTFLKTCSSGFHNDKDGDVIQTPYDPHITKKLLHLIRNPFDNVVANFHFSYKRVKKQRGTPWRFAYSSDGFREWCTWLDEKYTQDDLKILYGPDAAALAGDVLCHGEIFQYVQWHNNAFRVERQLNVPSLLIYYEDFHFDMDGNMEKLLKFFKLPRLADPQPFHYQPYPDHFTEEEVEATAKFIITLADGVTQGALARYIGSWMPHNSKGLDKPNTQ